MPLRLVGSQAGSLENTDVKDEAEREQGVIGDTGQD